MVLLNFVNHNNSKLGFISFGFHLLSCVVLISSNCLSKQLLVQHLAITSTPRWWDLCHHLFLCYTSHQQQQKSGFNLSSSFEQTENNTPQVMEQIQILASITLFDNFIIQVFEEKIGTATVSLVTINWIRLTHFLKKRKEMYLIKIFSSVNSQITHKYPDLSPLQK